MDNQVVAASPPLISNYSNFPKIQIFSLPKDTINYILNNLVSSKVYEKLIKTCKYFFLKKSVISIGDLSFNHLHQEWCIRKVNGFQQPLLNRKSKKLPEKLWFIGYIRFSIGNHGKYPGASSLIPKIYRCDITELNLCDQILSIDEFEIFISSGLLQNFTFFNSFIKNLDESIVPIQNLIEKLPNIKYFKCLNYDEERIHLMTSETAKALIEIPHFNSLETFIIENAPEIFNFITFLSGLKKPTKMNISLVYDNQLSDNYKLKINDFVDDLIAIWPNENRTPYLYFFGMNRDVVIEKLIRLRGLELVSSTH